MAEVDQALCYTLAKLSPYRMDKARKFGWHSHVDTLESMHEVFEKFVEFKMIPPMTAR